MQQKNYHTSITAKISPKEAFDNIGRVDAWWAKSFSGKATNAGDKFTVRFGDTWVDFEITVAIPGNKIAWKVTDCYLPFLKDKTEWNGTSVEWEISSENDTTRVDMTHVGLAPGVECYEICNKGWNEHIPGSLNNLLNKGQGQPQ
jgi:hypothetical protein